MLTRETLKIGGRYNWKNQPERLVYIGMCEPRNGRWHQFEKVDEPGVVWCEVLSSDLHLLEETPGTCVVPTFDFTIDPPGKHIRVLRWKDGGCRPAEQEELVMWDALHPTDAAIPNGGQKK